jgi:hypothetical protein
MSDTLKTRVVPTKYDADGLPYWESVLSPTENTVRAQCLVPPDKFVPIVFVPGVMGSNLRTVNPDRADGHKIAWRPDLAGPKDIARNAKARQKLLDAGNTVVDDAVQIGERTLISTTLERCSSPATAASCSTWKAS